MTLSAQDVHDKQFKLVRNSTGYDMDEVDAFLDEVEASVRELTDKLAAAESGAQSSEVDDSTDGTPAATTDVGATAASILELAQQTADEYVAQARRAAEGALADAQRSARESVQSLEEERRHLEDRVAALRTFESEVRSRLTGFFQSQLADLEDLTDNA